MSSVFAIDAIAAAVTAEFLERTIPAEVLIGEWATFKAKANARVIFGLGGGTSRAIGVGGDHYGPGVWFPTSTTTSARPLWACMQKIKVWVCYPPDRALVGDQKAIMARKGTWDLANSTMKAMWHAHGGHFEWSNLQWFNEPQAMATYGGALSFEAVFAVPVLDDDLTVAVADSFSNTVTFVGPDGTEYAQGSSSGP